MSESNVNCAVKLEPEESSVCTVSEDIIAQSTLSDGSLLGKSENKSNLENNGSSFSEVDIKCEVKLEPEESCICAVSEDLPAQSSLYEDYLSGRSEVLNIKLKVKLNVKHKNVKHKNVKHKNVKHKNVKHKRVKHKNVKHKNVKHKSVKHKSVKHKGSISLQDDSGPLSQHDGSLLISEVRTVVNDELPPVLNSHSLPEVKRELIEQTISEVVQSSNGLCEADSFSLFSLCSVKKEEQLSEDEMELKDELPVMNSNSPSEIKQEPPEQASSASEVIHSSNGLCEADNFSLFSLGSVKKEEAEQSEVEMDLRDIKQESEDIQSSNELCKVEDLPSWDSIKKEEAQSSDDEMDFKGIVNVKSEHECESDSLVRCGYPRCTKRFSNNSSMKKHIKRIHIINGQHCCTVCKKLFRRKLYLIRHVKLVHGDKKYDCDRCDYSCTFSHGLKRHISAVHLELKPHKCPHCDSCFAMKNYLTGHIKSVHEKEKPYECSACHKKFSERPNRDVHYRSVHCKEKPYSCDRCDYKCAQKYILTNHQKRVHDGVKPFGCTECGHKFTTQSMLKRHCVAVHYQLQPHLCNECGRAFGQASNLRSHIDTIHKGLKPYECSECDSKFSSNGDLQTHIKGVHRKEKPHSCSVCSKRFSSLAYVKAHVDAVHKGYEPYQCKQCNKSFSHKANFRRHMKTLHK